MGFWIAGGVLLILVFWYIATYNKLISFRNRKDEAFSTIDVYLRKRYDLIPNLVETVKGYAKHESQTLENVIAARSKAMQSAPAERIENEKELSAALGRLMVLTENYPNLKADAQFLDLQRQLQAIETDIAQSRKFYNGVVKQYNVIIESVPSNIVANLSKFEKAPFFQVEEPQMREAVKVQF